MTGRHFRFVVHIVRCVSNKVLCVKSDRYYCQGFDRINLGQLLDQIHIQLVGIFAITRQFYNWHEHQMLEEDQLMGAFGTFT